MKRIVVLCDGTWNRADAAHPTNVVRVAQALAPADTEGVAQVPIYIEGVGTGRGSNRAARFSDRILGGALGHGLLDNMVQAYARIVFMFEPEDEIYIFGFSRGAFTARALAGFIRMTGILSRNRMSMLPIAIERFRRRGDPTTAPKTEDSMAFRLNLSPDVITGDEEIAFREDLGVPSAPKVKLKYLGVWDTVGALGVPRHWLMASWINRDKYEFYDRELSSLVQRGRHAIALDETRRTFPPTLWTNLPELNNHETGENVPFQERYFAGDHGSVGGGGDIRALSDIALEWILMGVKDQGLTYDAQALEDFRNVQDPNGPLHNHSVRRNSLPERLMRRNPEHRAGPGSIDELYDTARARWATGPGPDEDRTKPYRPGSLKRVEQELAAFHTADDPATRVA
ncbi:DUF2235 domain-containing protein [Gymnodinialimonas sp. 2305UL16-5]|uniref:DUF2235 domain-containing protein n=1 Tax=Gymnodinialimonas mytili TaxID=3126503 RepID=UPI0030B702FF